MEEHDKLPKHFIDASDERPCEWVKELPVGKGYFINTANVFVTTSRKLYINGYASLSDPQYGILRSVRCYIERVDAFTFDLFILDEETRFKPLPENQNVLSHFKVRKIYLPDDSILAGSVSESR